ncbi:MAG: hypothetical protein ACI9J2_000759, partial [Saprospiraceae bacterium]
RRSLQGMIVPFLKAITQDWDILVIPFWRNNMPPSTLLRFL